MADPDIRALDRHALVMAIWLSGGFVAAALFKFGFGAGGWPFVACGFAVIIAGFIGHIIVNAIFQTFFTPKEIALGLVVYVVALLAFGLAILFSSDFRLAQFLPVSLGLIAVPAAAIFYMITHLGVRRAFESFDVIRQFR
jgi:hypothetical protein